MADCSGWSPQLYLDMNYTSFLTKYRMVSHRESYSHSSKNSQAGDYDPKGVEDDAGQGQLYSPAAAINHSRDPPKKPELQQGKKEEQEQRKMQMIMEKVLEKLGDAATVPKEAVDSIRQFLNSTVKDAHGLHRIKTRLLEFLPSSLASKLVDDAEKEANDEEEAAGPVESRRRDDDEEDMATSDNSSRSSPSSRL